MARVYLGTPETGDLSSVSIAQSGLSASTSNPTKGAYSFQLAAAAAEQYLAVGFNLAQLWIKGNFLFDTTAAPGAGLSYVCALATFRDAASNAQLATIAFSRADDNTTHIIIQDSASSTVATSADLGLVHDTQIRFEIGFTHGAGSGACEVRINGITVAALTLTGQQFGANNADRWTIGQVNGDTTGRNCYFSDCEIDDATWCGQSYVIARSPTTGTPTYDAWLKSTGTDASALLNDTPFTATDFVQTMLSSVAQSALIGTFATTQTGHGTGAIASGDTINGIKTALVAKTAFTTAAGITELGTSQGGSSTAGANITLTFSVAPIAGDIVIVYGGFGTAGGSSPGISTASYTNIFLDTATATRKFGMWYKVMGATPDTTVVCLGSGTAGDGVAYGSIVLRQTDNSVVLDITAAARASGSSTNPNPPASGATATANALAIAAACSAVNDTSVGTQTNYTQDANASANATRPFSIAASHRIITASATNEDPPAWSSWSTGAWDAATIIIRPALSAGSAMSTRRRVGGSDTDTALTLTTSDAYYESAVLAAPSYANLNAMEFGALHGNTSALQTVEDEWVMASYTPSAFTWQQLDADHNVNINPHLHRQPVMIGY